MKTVEVELGQRSYPVVVGPGARRELQSYLPARAGRVAVVTQDAVGVEVDPGVEWRRFCIGQGEEAKSLASVEGLCRDFSRWGVTRSDAVVAVGGGVVTDLAGFVASVYHRGLPVVHVATTLLAQVDAALGGKTGVNLPEGKNLVGSFWQPSAVLCDTEALGTLPQGEMANGLGEVAKYSLLGEEGLEGLAIEDKVARCVEIKAGVVSADERDETGARALLNYGHTLGHALEGAQLGDAMRTVGGAGTAGPGPLRHGEAVAVGLVFAARLARRLGRIGDAEVDRHTAVVSGYGLPTEIPPGRSSDELIALMSRDKKALDGLAFVLRGDRGPEVVRGVDVGTVRSVLAEMGAR